MTAYPSGRDARDRQTDSSGRRWHQRVRAGGGRRCDPGRCRACWSRSDAASAIDDRRIAAAPPTRVARPAMSARPARARAQLLAARLSASRGVSGARLLAFGEVGIGNTSAAAMLAHAVTDFSLDILAGNGAGVPPLGLDHKRRVLREAFARAAISDGHRAGRAADALAEFAGFEMVMMAGAFQSAARPRLHHRGRWLYCNSRRTPPQSRSIRACSIIAFSRTARRKPAHRALLGSS